MLCQTQLIRLLRSFGPSAMVEMITLSEVFSILLVMCHHMPPTNCRVSLSGMTTSARHWLASNMKPLYQPASSHWSNLVLLQARHQHDLSNTLAFFVQYCGAVTAFNLKGCSASAQYVLHIWSSCCTIHVSLLTLWMQVCVALYVWDSLKWWCCDCAVGHFNSSCFGDTLSGTEHYAVLFCCANSSLSHVCPSCPKIHKE